MFSPNVGTDTLSGMSGVLGSSPAGPPGGSPGLSSRLHGRGHHLRFHTIGDHRSLDERLEASLVPRDRSRFDVALRRSLGNWMFFVPATIGVLWLSTVIPELARVTSVLLGVLVVAAALPSVSSVVVALPQIAVRPFSRKTREGYLWFLVTLVMEGLDCAVYGTCILLLAHAGGFAQSLPSLPF